MLLSLKISGDADATSTVSSLAPVRIQELLELDQGRIAAFLDSGTNATAPIQMDQAASFVFANREVPGGASLYMVVADEASRQQEGAWNVIDGEVEDADQLAKNTYLLVPASAEEISEGNDDLVTISGRVFRVARFDGVDETLAAAALSDVRLEEGSLKIVVVQKISVT